jgi:hypothetical protein
MVKPSIWIGKRVSSHQCNGLLLDGGAFQLKLTYPGYQRLVWLYDRRPEGGKSMRMGPLKASPRRTEALVRLVRPCLVAISAFTLTGSFFAWVSWRKDLNTPFGFCTAHDPAGNCLHPYPFAVLLPWLVLAALLAAFACGVIVSSLQRRASTGRVTVVLASGVTLVIGLLSFLEGVTWVRVIVTYASFGLLTWLGPDADSELGPTSRLVRPIIIVGPAAAVALMIGLLHVVAS